MRSSQGNYRISSKSIYQKRQDWLPWGKGIDTYGSPISTSEISPVELFCQVFSQSFVLQDSPDSPVPAIPASCRWIFSQRLSAIPSSRNKDIISLLPFFLLWAVQNRGYSLSVNSSSWAANTAVFNVFFSSLSFSRLSPKLSSCC